MRISVDELAGSVHAESVRMQALVEDLLLLAVRTSTDSVCGVDRSISTIWCSLRPTAGPFPILKTVTTLDADLQGDDHGGK